MSDLDRAKAIAADVRARKAAYCPCECRECTIARGLPAVLNVLAAHKNARPLPSAEFNLKGTEP